MGGAPQYLLDKIDRVQRRAVDAGVFYVLPGECYIDVFMALLGVILFNTMTGGTVNEHSAPSGCS